MRRQVKIKALLCRNKSSRHELEEQLRFSVLPVSTCVTQIKLLSLSVSLYLDQAIVITLPYMAVVRMK